MSELHDHWLEQQIFLYESRYESRLIIFIQIHIKRTRQNLSRLMNYLNIKKTEKDILI